MKYFVTILLSAIIIGNSLFAQEYFDTKGKDFIVTFMPNIHTLNNIDSLLLFITSDVPTKGYIEYNDVYGRGYLHKFTINNPNEIYRFAREQDDFELSGVTEGGYLSQDETIARQSFRITSEEEVTVYGLNNARQTSDAFLVLPVDVLGSHYYVMAYNSDGSINNKYSTPSQFAVVAVEDGTEVQIMPSAPTFRYGNSKRTVIMNNGDVYLVQAYVSASEPSRDLTGTEIISNKPVAVFSGQKRASVPFTIPGDFQSRDHLAEQLPPVSTWGKNAFVMPFKPGLNEDYSIYKDLYRVMAAYDNTRVVLNGSEVLYLDKGRYIEREIRSAGYVEADKPVLTAEYKKTANPEDTTFYFGDPFMVIMPPKEQFLDNYKVINIEAVQELGNIPQPSFTTHYIGIIVPGTAYSTIKIDGMAVDQSQYKLISGSNYLYANIEVNGGVHILSGDQPFGTIVYGYAYANSYGYIGGMGMKRLDNQPPAITVYDSCYSVRGTAGDTSGTDTGMDSVYFPVSGYENMKFSVKRTDKWNYSFEARLEDIYSDGYFTVVAIDSLGLKTQKKITVPGFTVTADTAAPWNNVLTVNDTLEPGIEKCYYWKLSDYGGYTMDNIRLVAVNNLMTVSPDAGIIVNPGENIPFSSCVTLADYGSYHDTIIIRDDCGQRTAIIFNLTTISTDSLPPSITGVTDSCDQAWHLTVRDDNDKRDMGIEKIVVVDTVNCTVLVNYTNSKQTDVDVTVTDPYRDSYFNIKAVDSSGNQTTFSRSIPGFTVRLENEGDEHHFGTNPIGLMKCDTLTLYNYGSYPITFNDIPLEANLLFSVPQSQFPVTVEPGARKEIAVCYRPFINDNDSDSDRAVLVFKCLRKSLALAGNPDGLVFSGENKCKVPLVITTDTVPHDYSLQPVIPNPVRSYCSVIYSLPAKSAITLSVFDLKGTKTEDLFTGLCEKGWYKLDIDLSSHPAGTYFIALVTQGVVRTIPFIIE